MISKIMSNLIWNIEHDLNMFEDPCLEPEPGSPEEMRQHFLYDFDRHAFDAGSLPFFVRVVEREIRFVGLGGEEMWRFHMWVNYAAPYIFTTGPDDDWLDQNCRGRWYMTRSGLRLEMPQDAIFVRMLFPTSYVGRSEP